MQDRCDFCRNAEVSAVLCLPTNTKECVKAGEDWFLPKFRKLSRLRLAEVTFTVLTVFFFPSENSNLGALMARQAVLMLLWINLQRHCFNRKLTCRKKWAIHTDWMCFHRHACSWSVLILKDVSGFQVPLVGTRDVLNPRRVSRTHKQRLSAVRAALRSLAAWIMLVPRWPYSLANDRDIFKLTVQTLQAPVGCLIISAPVSCHLLNFVQVRNKFKKKHTNLGCSQSSFIMSCLFQASGDEAIGPFVLMSPMSYCTRSFLTKLDVWKCSMQSALLPMTLIFSDLTSLHVHFSSQKWNS